ncbi:tRNA glutamyl-Q(34) synthetase GluQRS [Tautonia marina]|uniref:tRNA glutamyl-Q(34) synthetase GluQRS n=1 Tax=Tautonia marina TaxID=2653855 RepID=UPI001F46F134|nr:tRNA glutamyl-Q(34) synthetase GluQRS [Tautonia marina]
MELLVPELRTNQVVGRFAPSPTGGLHVGHARTFLIAWLMARSVGGKVVLRIEDLDTSRVRPGMIDQAMVDLQWLGLDWDEGPDRGGPSGPYLQSLRFDHYTRALDQLKQANRIYPCTCSRAEIQRLASAPHLGEEGPVYPGTCACRCSDDAENLENQPFAWRFRVEDREIPWDDLFLGSVANNPASTVGDFIVGRSDGSISYQLAVVVDDAAMGVNQVIRGNDLVSSTPRQLLISSALGLQTPQFGHVPLVMDAQGRRLAKRDESIKLATLRAEGVEPARLMSWIGRSLGFQTHDRAMPCDWVGEFPSATGGAEGIVLDLDLIR